MRARGSLFRTALLGVAICGAFSAMASGQEPANNLPLAVNFYAGASYPSMEPAVSIEVHLNGTSDLATSGKIIAAVVGAEQNGWNCTSVSSYAVTVSGSKKRIPISAVLPVGHERCNDRPTPAPVLLVLQGKVDTLTQYVVSLAGLPGATTLASKPQTFPSAASWSLSALPAAAPAELLTNGASRDVGQLSLSSTLPFIGHSPAFVSTQDLFSTDSKDKKSAFTVTAGVQHGLLRTWYTPVQLSETIQGNQTASSLSAVSNLSVSGLVPWYWTSNALNNSWIDAGLSPEFTFAAQYTHRFAQVLSAKSPKLAVDDFSLHPSLTVEPFYLFPNACERYRKWIKGKPSDNTSRQFCLGYQFDFGLWYLPLDTTTAGSQRAEGSGDFSILIPFSNLNFEKFRLIEKDGLLNSELSIRYSDTVNPACNYVRSKQWTFGIQVMK